MSELTTPPKSKGHWLLGDTFEIVKSPLHYVIDRNKTLGDIFEADSVYHKVVFASRPEFASHLLVENNKSYQKSFDYGVLKMVLGEGLLSSEGSFWLKQRRLAQPAFHKKRLDLMFEVMRDETSLLLSRLEAIKQSGAPFNLVLEMATVTIHIVAKTLFGTEIDSSIDEVGRHISTLNGYISNKVNNPLMAPLWVPNAKNRAFKKAKDGLDKIIFDIIAKRHKTGGKKDDLLQMLMDARDEDTGEGMSDQQLRDEILTLFTAGHETSATSLCWIFILLARNPQWADACKKEIAEILGDRLPTLEDYPKFALVKRALDEALRMYPPAWIVGRKALQDDEVDGVKIKKGQNIIISTYQIHRHPAFWPNPDAFDPDRFLPEFSTGRHKFAYFPFGAGPRMCIGNNFAMMEMTLILVMVLQKFTLSTSKEVYEWESLVTLRPKGEVPFLVK